MKSILIIGAGGHGQVVAETAEACGYIKIDFLDDQSEKAIGRISDLADFCGKYEEAFAGIGNNVLRDRIMDQLQARGFRVPVLVHPTAYVSKSANLAEGTIIEPKAIVNSNAAVGRGGIVSVGAIIDHDVQIGRACHINAGAIVKAGGRVADCQTIDAGKVVSGFAAAEKE